MVLSIHIIHSCIYHICVFLYVYFSVSVTTGSPKQYRVCAIT